MLILAIVISLPPTQKYLIPFSCKFVFNIDPYIFTGSFILFKYLGQSFVVSLQRVLILFDFNIYVYLPVEIF